MLLEKVLLLMVKEESLDVIMTPPLTSAVLLEKVLLLMVKEESSDVIMTPPSALLPDE